ncbi:MAG TPA: hypothetical protein PLL26_01405 [Candidatus Dojkabacteria bacterium]|nr:hypothetical protein [Candidatus Dojkabacteria bacterium]
MSKGAQKTKELLKDPFFKFLTVNQKKEIIHIVSVHDTLEEIKTDNERFF